MKKPNHETIYLIPGSYDGEHCYVWSDDPAPGAEDNPADAVAYVRADLVPEGNAVLAQRIVDLTADRDRTKYKLSGVLDEISDFCASLDGALIDGQGADELVDDMNLRLTHYGLTDADRKFNPFNQPAEKTAADYMELQQHQDELQTILFNERQKSQELAEQVEQLQKEVSTLRRRGLCWQQALISIKARCIECIEHRVNFSYEEIVKRAAEALNVDSVLVDGAKTAADYLAAHDAEVRAQAIEAIDAKEFIAIAMRHCEIKGDFAYSDVSDAFDFIANQIRQRAKAGNNG